MPEESNSTKPIIQLRGVSKSFGGVTVLKEVDFDVRPGEVHALLGENGAGKSTLIKIMGGVHQPEQGKILVQGQSVNFPTPKSASDNGIAIVYQELLLFPELSVAENIFIGHAPIEGFGRLNWESIRNSSRELLRDLESSHINVDTPVGNLSVANRQRVEIAKALSQNARVVIMDEPTASLAESDVKQLLEIIRRLRDRGVGIVYISHKLPEVFALADRVTVLRDGVRVGSSKISEVDEAELVSQMVGRSIDQLFPKVSAKIGDPLLELENISYEKTIENISLTLRSGEILGIAGLVGSGRTELALTIFGITPATAGKIKVAGQEVTIDSPRQARDLGLAYVPEDRGIQGLVKPQNIAQNIAHTILKKLSRMFLMDRKAEDEIAQDSIHRLGIRARGPAQLVRQLSGGNQQKVVLAKWLATQPKILIMDEPTRGIDVGAKSEIHALMSKLAGDGMAILMISSELPEVLGMSDRVLVMHSGKLVGEFNREEATPEAIGAAMTLSTAQEAA